MLRRLINCRIIIIIIIIDLIFWYRSVLSVVSGGISFYRETQLTMSDVFFVRIFEIIAFIL